MKKLVILFSLLAFSFTGCESKPDPVIYYSGQKVKDVVIILRPEDKECEN